MVSSMALVVARLHVGHSATLSHSLKAAPGHISSDHGLGVDSGLTIFDRDVEKAALRLSRDTDLRRSLDMSQQQSTLSRIMLAPRLDYLKFLVVMTH